MLSARQLCVVLEGRRILDDFDLHVPAGRIHALLGHNGAGKTTALNCLLGFVKPSSGVVLVDGVEPALHPAEARRRLAYLPEQVALYPYLSGTENLRYFCAIAGTPMRAEVARAALVDAGLPAEMTDRRAERYSKGMRQKVGIAIAQARRAKALLLDEPTSGLDPGAAALLADQVRACAASGMAVLVVSHDLAHVRQFAHRVGILKGGRCIAELDPLSVGQDELERLYFSHI